MSNKAKMTLAPEQTIDVSNVSLGGYFYTPSIDCTVMPSFTLKSSVMCSHSCMGKLRERQKGTGNTGTARRDITVRSTPG